MSNVSKWLKKHSLPKWLEERDIVAEVPGLCDDEVSGEFYIRTEGIGNKHYIAAENEMKLAEWLRLTVELFDE